MLMSSPTQVATRNYVVLAGSGITLSVVSADQNLVVLCREVLRESGNPVRDLEVSSGAEVTPSTGVCLWDYDSGGLPEGDEFANSRILYLIAPSQVESLLRNEPAAAGNVLLKPVTRAVLRAFLASVVPLKDSTASAEVGTLRANRDELLQRLLHANLRLQEYDQQRTNFIARAVHDFRAPLTALSGFCGLACRRPTGTVATNSRKKPCSACSTAPSGSRAWLPPCSI